MNWRARVLRDLWAAAEVVLLRREFDAAALRELIDLGVFRLGLLPEDGAELFLEVEGGEPGWFNVLPRGASFACYENTEVVPRTMKVGEEELRFCHLERTGFYALVAEELGCRPRVCEVCRGIWQIGTRSIPQMGNAAVIVAEPGCDGGELRHLRQSVQFKHVWLLLPEGVAAPAGFSGGDVHCAALAVAPGGLRYSSTLADDIADADLPDTGGAFIDLDRSPAELIVGGKRLTLPMDRSRPALGVRFLAHLFENPRVTLSCWELERAVKSELVAITTTALGSDRRMDERARRGLDEAIRKVKIEVEDSKNDPQASPVETAELEGQLADLLARRQADTEKGGASRLLGDGDKEKARRRVRKALAAVVAHVKRQSQGIADDLEQALGEGGDVFFNPPANWDL